MHCFYKAVSAEKHRAEAIRDALICGLLSRLLENVTLDLTTTFDQTRIFEQAQKISEAYSISQTVFSAAAASEGNTHDSNRNIKSTAASQTEKCLFCGNNKHPRRNCPARNATC